MHMERENKVPLSSLEVSCQFVAPADLPPEKTPRYHLTSDQKGSKTGMDTIKNRTEQNRTEQNRTEQKSLVSCRNGTRTYCVPTRRLATVLAALDTHTHTYTHTHTHAV